MSLIAGMAACSSGTSDSSNASGSSGSSGAASSSGGSEPGAGGSDAATGDAGAGATDGSAPAKSGQVIINAPWPESGQTLSTVNANYCSTVGSLLNICKVVGEENGCIVAECERATVDGGVESPCSKPETQVSAGTVKVSGGSGMPAIQMTYDPGVHGYVPFSADTPLWKAGEKILIEAAGDGSGAPAYSQTLLSPAKISITAPTLTQAGVQVDRGSDLAFSWTGGTHGNVFVTFTAGRSGAHYYGLSCDWSATAGAGTVKAGLLSKLPVGPALVGVATTVRSTMNQGDWQLSGVTQSTVGGGIMRMR